LLAADSTSGVRRDLRRACVADLCFRLDVAGARTGTAALLARRRSVRGRPASRNRHRIALGGIGARACSRSRLLRRDRPRRRQDRLDPDRGRLLGHRPASRLRGGSARRLDRGGHADRHGRPKRRGRVVGALRLSGRAAKRRAERVPGSAPFLAAARGCAELAACERGATGSCRFHSGPGGAGRAGGRRVRARRSGGRCRGRPRCEEGGPAGSFLAHRSPCPNNRLCGPRANIHQPARPR
jgi:hypothetical protein